MAIPQLQIQTRPAKIGIQTHDAQLSYRQFKAEQSIQQPKADVSIEQKPGKLTIDQSAAWSNLHLKSSFERTRDTAVFAKQHWLEYIARVSQEGDDLMKIENNGNPIASHAARNAVLEFDYQVGNTPRHELVKLSYQAYPAEINIQKNDPIIETTPRYPQFQFQRGSVDISLRQHPSIQIDWKV